MHFSLVAPPATYIRRHAFLIGTAALTHPTGTVMRCATCRANNHVIPLCKGLSANWADSSFVSVQIRTPYHFERYFHCNQFCMKIQSLFCICPYLINKTCVKNHMQHTGNKMQAVKNSLQKASQICLFLHALCACQQCLCDLRAPFSTF